MSGSRIRSRSHSGNVGGFEDEEACGRGPPSRGRDIDNHGNRRRQHLRNDRTGRVDQPAGCAQLDEHGIGIGLAGLLDGAADVLVADGLDGVVQLDLDDAAGGSNRDGEKYQKWRSGTERAKSKHTAPFGGLLVFYLGSRC